MYRSEIEDEKPKVASLMNKNSSLDIETQTLWKKFTWKRPEDIFKGAYQVFEDDIEMQDIKQGALGNCYFLSSLAAMAIDPTRIRDLFVTKTVNLQGKYIVKLYLDGVQREVTIDDYFPYDPITKRPAFSQTNGNELWVLILEKAWAKINGNYENTIGGLTHDSLSFLIPAPSTSLDH